MRRALEKGKRDISVGSEGLAERDHFCGIRKYSVQVGMEDVRNIIGGKKNRNTNTYQDVKNRCDFDVEQPWAEVICMKVM